MPVPFGNPTAPATIATDEDGTSGAMTDTAAHTILAAVVGKQHIVTLLTLTNTSTTFTGVQITGLNSGVTLTFPAPATGGAIIAFTKPLVGAINTALQATCLTTGTNTFACTTGYNE